MTTQARWLKTKAFASYALLPANTFVPIATLSTSAVRITSICTGFILTRTIKILNSFAEKLLKISFQTRH